LAEYEEKLKIIVVSGSHSNIGKTTVLRNIQAKLQPLSAVAIKIGHRPMNADKPEKFFSNIQEGMQYIESIGQSGNTEFLLIESNSILNHLEPDLVVFLKGKDQPEKDSAGIARPKADIIVDENFDYSAAAGICAEKTGVKSIADALLEQYEYLYG
jgi:molybdopterin-guanine dinucleotide biosynthesis protein